VHIKQKLQPWRNAGLVRSLFFAVSLIAVFGFHPTQALSADRYFDLGSFNAPASASFAQIVGAGTFLDVYSFEYAAAEPQQGLISVALGAVGITDLMVGLWSNGTEIAAQQTLAASFGNFSTYVDLEANSFYEIRVSGDAGSPNGGAYGGAFGLAAVSPAPEPEVYAMMTIGLAVMGWASRRKRKLQVQPAA